ncbi:hypothetical protein DMH01_32610 [Amycolatopsis sp. WAC 04182]|uniref:acyl-CoA dehydrogenase family protein n=1 Tax=Amycolatopsis sp. WAC 04182 TaxID=2203198 RepID=UPI000F7AD4F3|nr:acyl-CoA dehydrogenase [Amycolatopsis sp. WAC 04182]RSN55083.1 hypothetical protein DMH01_32610 [Amycolatopsis sp. WAC 04182]
MSDRTVTSIESVPTTAVEAAGTLAGLLAGPLPAESRREILDLFGHEIFTPRHGHPEVDGYRLTYQRMRHVADHLGRPNLAHDPHRLFELVAAAGVVDPSLSVAMVIHHGLCLSFLEDLVPDPRQLREEKDALMAVQAAGHLLVTELGYGSSQLQVHTTVTYDPGDRSFVLHTPNPAARKFMGNVGLRGVPRLAVINARLVVGGRGRGAFPFLVPMAHENGPLPGVRVLPTPAGVVPLDYALVDFDHVRLPFGCWLSDGAVIDDDGEFTDPHSGDSRIARSLTAVQNVWTGMSGALAAISRTSAATALRLATQRTALARVGTARPLIDYVSQQRSLFSCLASALTITCLANDARRVRSDLVLAWRNGDPGAPVPTGTMTWTPWTDVNRTLAVTKVMAAWAAEAITAECRLRCGVMGSLTASRFLDYQGLGHMLNSGGGDNLLILLDAARALVTEAGSRPAPSIPETHTRTVSDPGLLRDLLAVQEHTLAHRIHEAVEDAKTRGMDDFEVWNPHTADLRVLGETHGQRLAVESLIAALDTLPDTSEAATARHLGSVHVLDELSRRASWFLCEDLLGTDQVRGIESDLAAHCAALAGHTDELLDAFGDLVPLSHSLLGGDDYIRSVIEWAESSA